MIKTQTKKPKLRFRGFSNEWQAKNLKDISKKVSERNKSVNSDTVLTNSAIRGIILQTDFFDKEIAVQGNLGNYFKVAKDDFVYNPRISRSAPVGPFKRNHYGEGSMSPLYTIFRFNQKENLNFFEQYLSTQKWYRYMRSVANYGARYDRMAISIQDLENLPMPYPEKAEQVEISGFLGDVDDRISGLEKKKELLEKYKKGIIQKIFTQQIRFKDENGKNYPDWQERKLSSLLIERDVKAPISDRYPLMAFVAYKGVIPKGKRYNREFLVNDKEGKKYKRTEHGDFIYSSNNLETGSIGMNRYGSASISPVYSIFQVKEVCDAKFIGSFLVRKRFIYEMTRYRQGVIYGQWRIHESDFLKMKERIPSIKEQRKIGDFLKALDDKIELTKRELEQARNWKKGLLQQMFV